MGLIRYMRDLRKPLAVISLCRDADTRKVYAIIGIGHGYLGKADARVTAINEANPFDTAGDAAVHASNLGYRVKLYI